MKKRWEKKKEKEKKKIKNKEEKKKTKNKEEKMGIISVWTLNQEFRVAMERDGVKGIRGKAN